MRSSKRSTLCRLSALLGTGTVAGWVGAACLLSLASCGTEAPEPVRLGADRILDPEYLPRFRGQRIGLITNQTGVDSHFLSTLDKIGRQPDLDLRAVFAPEHGLSGQYQAGESAAGNARFYSLYTPTGALAEDFLEDLDLLLFDVQDVGARFYTYISTLFQAMKAAAAAGVGVVVLDRPNPLGGERVEGPVLEAGLESFVGIFPLPVRHGMTVGELGRLFNGEAEIGADLFVVPMSGWRRPTWYDETGLQWINPSPNMPSLETATVYPGFCLIEGTNLSEGRGTTRPFELVGAPWLDSEGLVAKLNSADLSGVRFRSQAFIPTFSKYAETNCSGVQVHVLDRDRFRPVRAALTLLRETLLLHPDRFEFQAETFDRLIGNHWVREKLLEGATVESMEARWQEQLDAFRQLRTRYLLYR